MSTFALVHGAWHGAWCWERLTPELQAGAYPVVDTTYVVCDEDRMVNPNWSRRIARDWLDADLVEMPGSHSPFLSRPRDLATLLDRLA